MIRNPIRSTSLLLSVVLTAACSSAPKSGESAAGSPSTGFYHRLYQGYRLSSVKPAAFEDAMNADFLPLFTKAHAEGLEAYRPALPTTPAGCLLPSEIALLTFKSEDAYNRYRETSIGEKIRDAHTKVFHPETSRSLVPEPYQKSLAPDHAYTLNPSFQDYANAESALLIHCNPRMPALLLPELNQLYGRGSEAANIVFAVGAAHLVEYVFARDADSLEKALIERNQRLKSVYRRNLLIRLEKQKIGSSRVKPGEGLDARW